MNFGVPIVKFREEWNEAKREHPNAILLFRMADHLEAFFDDAELLEKVLELRCTRWDNVPTAGFPTKHEHLIGRLKELGHTVGVYTPTEIGEYGTTGYKRAYAYEEK